MNTPPNASMGLDFQKYPESLMPTIAQDRNTWEILMVWFANPLALQKTRETWMATFWSRSRNELWTKWLSSWDTLMVENIFTDCDRDTLIYLVTMKGKWACHIDSWRSCFRRKVDMLTWEINPEPENLPLWSRVNTDEQLIIESRASASKEVSFTAKLAQWTWWKLVAKVTEETFEAVTALTWNEGRGRIISELADIDYVTRIVLAKINQSLRDQKIPPISVEEIEQEIMARRK